MFEGVLHIIKNIIIFSLISFVFLELCPKEEYKKYINLFTGFVLIIIVLNPLSKYFGKAPDIGNMVNEYFIANELKDMEYFFEDYDQMRVEFVVAGYENEIIADIKAIVESEQLLLDSADIMLDTDVDSEGFLAVTEVSLVVTKKYTDSSERIKEIVLAETGNAESVQIINIKNKISQVYNVSLDNININK